ncbi:MAG: UDP-N-acetylglucosamine 1-carboxyvinyltransferase [Myxococcota bacterium]|nr:UDP-N-acetylglucosamine 1-carboxyvinyltransferase [Myxococcota bacterium]
MDRLEIEGGAPLRGEVQVSGSKNATLPALFATLLAPGVHHLRCVPDLRDIRTTFAVLRTLGVQVEMGARSRVQADASKVENFEAPYDLVRTMRASILALGPLVARHGKARVSLPGGCAIGARPIDQHLKALRALGAQIDLEHGYVNARAKRLTGARIVFDQVTVGGTEQAMMAAVLARGETVLENAAREPEISELAKILTSMGAKIDGAGDSVITISGVDELRPMDHAMAADRIEAGSFMVAAAMTRGDLLIRDCPANHLDAVIEKLREAGAQIETSGKGVRVRGPDRLQPVQITTAPYPGFPTDMQAQLMAACAIANGASVIRETIFENRYMHVPELVRMGADITVEGHTAVIRGVSSLSGAPVMASDLRAGVALVIAGLAARGKTVVNRVYHLDRGYEGIEKKLRKAGARIRRVRSRG